MLGLGKARRKELTVYRWSRSCSVCYVLSPEDVMVMGGGRWTCCDDKEDEDKTSDLKRT